MTLKKYTIKPYETKDYPDWNAFVSKAKNATFLFHRDFMEYHKDRFEDFSLMIFEENKLVAVLPANKVENTVYSHQGLTYGGLVYDEKIKLKSVIAVFENVLKYLNQNQIQRLQIKLIPSIYCAYFSEEMEYGFFLTQAKLVRRDCLSVIDLTKPYSVTKPRRQNIRRGSLNNLIIKEEPCSELFWSEILIPNMEKKHSVKPVHTLDEIIKLQQKFPENIRHFNVYHDSKIVAGTTVFCTDKVAHPQYISGNEQKNELGSLDYLYHHLITEVFKDKNFFDFGPSHEEDGKKVNEGILFWKESFGTQITVHDFYEVLTSNHSLLENFYNE